MNTSSCEAWTARPLTRPWVLVLTYMIELHFGLHCAAETVTSFLVEVDLRADLGQHFGTHKKSRPLTVLLMAGFALRYSTQLRSERHAVQFFDRPT